jgi:type VI secretion system secreted protein Hcp
MAFDAFLKVDGIQGESTDKNHPNEIQISSYSWGVSNPTSVGSGSGGAGTGKASFQDVSFSSPVSKAGPNLMLACAIGKHIPSALLTLRKGGGGGLEFVKIRLQDVLVSSYSDGGDAVHDDRPTDEFSLAFGSIDFTYTAQTGEVVESSVDLRGVGG